MKSIKSALLGVLLLPLLLCASAAAASTTSSAKALKLKEECQAATEHSRHRQALVLADRLHNLGLRMKDDYTTAYGLYYQGISNVITGNPEEGKQQLDQALILADKLANDTLRLQIHNGLGIYEADARCNPALAQQHFFKSLEYAVAIGDGFRQAMMECNLAETAYIRRDSTGIKYALSCYEWGRDNRNPQMMFAGAYQCANLYRMTGDDSLASNYADIAENVLNQYGHQDEESSLWQLKAAIDLDRGQLDMAEEKIRRALMTINKAQAATLPEIYLCYARILSGKGQDVASVRMIDRGLKLCDSLSTSSSRASLYELKSEILERCGNIPGALEAYKQYKRQNDSINSVQERQSINELRVQYDIDKREREADLSLLLLDNERKRNIILAISLFSVIVILLLLLWNHQHLRKLYKAIVLQHRQELERQRQPAGISEEKADELYRQLCNLMELDKIYTDAALTRDKVAEMLGTNRTYLTQLISDKAAKSYPQFINEYRIRHAVKVLSDPAQTDYPLKALAADAGFSSISTFYKTFQSIVGMTPSLYRNVSKGV